MIEGTFFFITSEVEFQESTKKGARILATFMELDKPSANNRIYRFVEGATIAKSLIGKPIRYGASIVTGKHYEEVPNIGEVETAYQKGKKIKGIVLIWAKDIIAKLKKGVKFLFSVGGVAQFGEAIKRGKKIVERLYNAVCTHLQLLPNIPEGAGFPSAKMHKVIEINESVMFTDYDRTICFEGECEILSNIKNEFEEAKRIKKRIKEKAINKAIAIGIADTIEAAKKAIIKEPWIFEEEDSS